MRNNPKKQISVLDLHRIAGGVNDDPFIRQREIEYSYEKPNSPPSFLSSLPVHGSIQGNQDGAFINLNVPINNNFAITGSAVTDYNRLHDKTIMIVATYAF